MDWFNEILGLLIVLFIFLFPVLRKILLGRDKKREAQKLENPFEEEAYEFEEEEKSTSKRPYTTQRLVKKDVEYHSKIEERELESKIEGRHLGTTIDPKFKQRIVSQAYILEPVEKGKQVVNPLIAIFQKRSPLQRMVILSEIFKLPDERSL